jgi:hypothetical protein
MVLQGDSLVALRATLYGPPTDDDDSPLIDRSHDVRVGPWSATLTDLLHIRFPAEVREILRFEVDHVGDIDVACPLRLERSWEMNAGTVVVEIVLLPCGADEGADLFALVTENDVAEGIVGELGWEFAMELEERWEMRGQVPSLRLDVDFLSALEQAPLAEDDTAALEPIGHAPVEV